MSTITNQGRRVGLLFLGTFIAGATGTALRGLSGVDVQTTALLSRVAEQTDQMKIAIGLDMLASAIIVGIALYLFPLMHKANSRFAVAYTGIAVINFALITLSNVLHISLISVASDFSTTAITGTASFISLAKMLYESYYWIHFLMLILYSLGGAVLYYFLYSTRLVAPWLGVWGILASVIVFFGGALNLADISVPFWFFLQNGIFMLVFIVYLIAVGFRKREPALKTENNGA